jgi:16S rRNA (cytosine967-C5)-methyltransferase
MPVSPARKIAFDVLREVASQGAYASELLYERMGPSVSRADAGLATELTLGVLRWQGLLDFLLQRNLDRPVERLDLEVLLALRMGLYQLRFLERVPAHAAVSESVELAKRARKHSASSFVNAVLRKATRDAKISGEQLTKLLPGTDTQRLAILYSHPAWLVERWVTAYGAERTTALLEANNRPAGLSCAILDSQQDAAAIADSLKADGLVAAPGRWLRSALTISSGNPSASKAFQQGKISFQDEASQMVAHLVDAQPGQRVLDLCSAPGGKTTILARSTRSASPTTPGGQVTATDLHEHRLRTTRQQLTRTATQNVTLLALDATQPLPFVQPFDRILLDAPCSGTGTLARNPEIRWRLQPADLRNAQRQQTAMLRQALAILPPGGRLIYATCSLEPEENDEVVQDALPAATGLRIVSGFPALTPHLRSGVSGVGLFDERGFFRTFPPESQTDGFFAAILERTQ